MVNWQDPAIKLFSAHVSIFLANVSTGVYLWEFSISFGFDWQFFSRKRPFRWTLVPYFIARYACAIGFLVYLYPANVFRPISSCMAWWKVLYFFAHLAMGASSFLLVVRVIAIAEQTRWIMIGLGILWLAEIGTSIHSFATVQGLYVPQMLACGAKHTVVSLPYRIVSLALHFACLAIVLFLLLRSRGAKLWSLLLSQGIIYFAVSMVVHISTLVLLLLDLNDGMNQITLVPTLTALAICATRMYRGLVMYRHQIDLDAFIVTANPSYIHHPSAPVASNREAHISIVVSRDFYTESTTEEDLRPTSRKEFDATMPFGG